MERRVVVPLIVAFALLMQNLDSTALVTSLPLIAQSLGEPPLRLHMAITGYMLAFAAALPVSGWLADRFGARLIFRLAMAIFTLASVACGFSHSFEELIFFRLLQGIGGALMVPVGRLILVRAVPKSELVGAMALMGMPTIIGPLLGPVMGGFITTFASWRWIFWMNVPIGIVGIVLVTRFIDDVRETDVKPFDWKGFWLLGFGLVASLFGMDAVIARTSLDPVSLGTLTAGLIALALYVIHARKVKFPLIDLGLLKIPTFRATVTGGSLFRGAIGANPFLLPLMMQEGFGYSPFESGIITCCSAAGAFGMRTISKRVLRRFGFRNVLIWNSLIAAMLFACCGFFQPSTPQFVMMIVIFSGGVFRSLEFTAISAIAFAEIERAQMSQATSFSQMAQRLSMSLGVAFAAFLLHQFAGDPLHVPVKAFQLTFAVIGFISAMASFAFWRLPHDAGAVLAGRGPVERRTRAFRD